MGSVGIGCVDKVDAELHRAAQDCDRLPSISWFTPNAGTRQLHRTVAQAVNGKITADRKPTALCGGSFVRAYCRSWRSRPHMMLNSLNGPAHRSPPLPMLPTPMIPIFIAVLPIKNSFQLCFPDVQFR